MVRQRPIMVVSIAAAAFACFFAAGWWGGLRINFTPSYPLGLWRIEPLGRPVAVGDLIFICAPEIPAFDLAFKRGYVWPGMCPGGRGPLIKMVVATAGQHVEIGRTVIIDGQPLAHSEIRGVDADGRALDRSSGGIVPAGELFLHSDFVGSYDSRYFGPIPASGLLGFARPILTIGQ